MSSKNSLPKYATHSKELPSQVPIEQIRQLIAELSPKEVFDTEDAAQYLCVSKQLLELLRVQGGGPRYAKLQRLVRYRRVAALLDHLLNVDISTFNIRQLPKTLALLETKLLSMSPVQRCWFACLCEGTNGGASGGWDREVECVRLHDLYSEHPALKGQTRRATEGELGKFLARAVPGLRDVRRRTAGANSRQVRYWVFPSLDECRAAFSKAFGQDFPWDDGPMDDLSTVQAKRRPKY